MIPIDQRAVDNVLAGFQAWARKQAEHMDRTGQGSLTYTGTKRPTARQRQDMSASRPARPEYYDRVTLTTPWGAKRVVNIHILPAQVPICCGGEFKVLSQKNRSYVVSVFFPATMPPESLADDRVAFQLRGALLHELTHALDKIATIEERSAAVLSGVRGLPAKKAKQVALELGEDFGKMLALDPRRVAKAAGVSLGKIEKVRQKLMESQSSVSDYYNRPHEVRAFLRMLYEEIRPVVAMFQKRVPRQGLESHIEAALHFSDLWNWDMSSGSARRVVVFPEAIRERFMQSRGKPTLYHEYLTPKNRNYILKKLYQALSKDVSGANPRSGGGAGA